MLQEVEHDIRAQQVARRGGRRAVVLFLRGVECHAQEIHVCALLLAAEAVALPFPHHGEDIIEILFHGISLGRGKAVVEQMLHGVRRQQHGNDRLLTGAYFLQIVNAQLVHDTRGIEPERCFHDVAPNPVNGLTLQFAGHDIVVLLSGRIVHILAEKVLLHVIHIALVLRTHGTVHLVQVVILAVGLRRPLLNVLHDTLQVLDAIVIGTHLVVAQVFRL